MIKMLTVGTHPLLENSTRGIVIIIFLFVINFAIKIDDYYLIPIKKADHNSQLFFKMLNSFIPLKDWLFPAL